VMVVWNYLAKRRGINNTNTGTADNNETVTENRSERLDKSFGQQTFQDNFAFDLADIE
ncbi:hypothetical protein KI387_016283, partial [Taxus chinensis]